MFSTALSWQKQPKRALLLCGAGAVIGLGIAGFGLFTAKGTATRNVPPEDVALVNQHPILLTDYTAQLETLYNVPLSQATRGQKQQVLNDMIREELYVQRGLELDMPSSDPDTRTALVAAVEQQAAADAAAGQPSETDLRSYFNAHKDKYSSDGRLLMHDLVFASHADIASSMASAAKAVQELKGGTALPDVMQKYHLVESGKLDGEEFYFAAKIHLGDALFEAAKALPTGTVSDPISASDGPHILVMTKNTPPIPQTFETAQESVLNDYRRDMAAKMQAEEEQYLRGKAEILIRPQFK
jgi:parvulin-like peptidyl-prolyl isomerase